TNTQVEIPATEVKFQFPRQGDLYSTELITSPELACASMNSKDLHAAWGHPGEKAMSQLNKAYPHLKLTHPAFCETCTLGKQSQLPYPLTHNTSYQPLEVIHTDICESKCRGFDGSYYAVTFID